MLRRSFSLLTFGAMLLAPAVASPAPAQCDRPNILILLDVSGSMKSGTPSKLEQATAGIEQAVGRYQDVASFGLMVYPRPAPSGDPGTGTTYGFCNVATGPAIGFGQADAQQAIGDYLRSIGTPHSDYDTPIYQALNAAGALPAFSSGGRNYILLITDGQQDCCDGGDFDYSLGHVNDCTGTPDKDATDNSLDETEAERNRQQIVALAGTLYAGRGITIFPVGFSELSDAKLLNRIAAASETSRAGCDPTSAVPSAPDNCYYPANDSTSLDDALSAIVRRIGEETCDGFDNDCDGVVDNVPGTTQRLSQGCSSECGGGKQLCTAQLGSSVAEWGACDAAKPASEICDGLDNDCDGRVDNLPGSADKLFHECSTCLGEGKRVCDSTLKDYATCTAPVPSSPQQCTGNNGATAPPPAPANPPPTKTPTPEPQAEPPEPPEPRRGVLRDGCACQSTDPAGLAGSALLALATLALRRRRSRA